ncbi:class I fructose-bisphosphate aldolase [Paenibacillus sp. L3-i20]|uniref:class I fructose-bisphosphate aldolase n=1 Tax=Paenibacillus sp. L3-i20 TaxID=2905833 RepID=UPI001EE043E7|nr:deoxyribose-phosphate aldolase [Paenibacillus sp. L3-i20]GKU77251.1 fructose-bisphosphate aldolase [Paenibacillus sp. L3-i20]
MNKIIRMSKLLHPKTGKAVMLPIDHGTTLGPIRGLRNIPDLVEQACENQVQAIIGHKGTLYWALRSSLSAPPTEFILHMSASTSMGKDQTFKQMVSSMDHALSLGVTAVSVHINFGVSEESAMLREFGQLSDQAYKWGMPLLAMVNVHGEGTRRAGHIAHAVRVVGEMGADLVKVEYPGDQSALLDVLGSFPIPVLIAGGSSTTDKLKWFEEIHTAMLAGAKGICPGRNVFEDENPSKMLQAINMLIHELKRPAEVFEMYESKISLAVN